MVFWKYHDWLISLQFEEIVQCVERPDPGSGIIVSSMMPSKSSNQQYVTKYDTIWNDLLKHACATCALSDSFGRDLVISNRRIGSQRTSLWTDWMKNTHYLKYVLSSGFSKSWTRAFSIYNCASHGMHDGKVDTRSLDAGSSSIKICIIMKSNKTTPVASANKKKF